MAYIGQEPVNTFSPVPSKDSFTGDGSTTTFDLGNSVVSGGQNALEVFVNNVRQEPGSGKAFTLGVDGNNEIKRITFSAAPASGASIYVINDKTSSTSTITPSDLNGAELILDADADSSLTADTDDRIDFKLAGTDHIQLGTSSGDTTIKIATDAKDLQFLQADGNKLFEINDGNFVGVGGNSAAPGEIRIYEDTDNGSHYTGFKAGNNTASVAYVLPTADGVAGTSLTTDGSGTLSWSASLSIANDGNNRITTATGSSGLNGEANLQFDGSTLAVTGATTISTNLDVDGTTNLDAVDIDGAVQIDGTVTVGVDDTGYDFKLFGDTASAFALWDASADDLILSGAAGLIVPEGQLTLGSTAITLTAAELNILDGSNSASAVTIVDADRIILNDGGTMKQVAVSALNTYTSSSVAASSISAGSSAVSITTSSGNITIDAAANDTDIIFKGTDDSSDITMLTLDGSAAGEAIFNAGIVIADAGNIGSASDKDALAISSGGVVTFSQKPVINSGVAIDNITIDGTEIDLSSGDLTIDVAGDITLDAGGSDIRFDAGGSEYGKINLSGNDVNLHATINDSDIVFKGEDNSSTITALTLDMSDAGTAVFNHDIRIADDGQIGSASDADAIAISSGGVVTFTQAPVFPDGSIAVADLDIDGATDIGADIVDADLFIIDDGAGGTNRKTTASRIKTYIGGGTQWQAVKTGNYTAAAGQGVFANTTSSSFTITLPAGTLGDEVTIVDYAGTFDSNALTVAANGSEKIFGSTDDLTVSTERAAFTLVFTDSTQGWLFKND